jgi:hypothetical protein
MATANGVIAPPAIPRSYVFRDVRELEQRNGQDEEALDAAEEKRARKAAKRARDAERVAAGRKGGA